LGGVVVDVEALVVELVFFDGLRVERLEGAEADVEGYFGAAGWALLEDILGEMEAGGGSGDTASFAGEDGLVAFGVVCVVRSADVGREGDVAVGFDGLPFVFGVEADAAFAVFKAFFDAGFEARRELHHRAWREFAAGSYKGSPGVAELFGEEDFDAAGVAGAVADEAGFEDARVVEDEEIGGLEVAGEVAELAVLPGLGFPVEDQHAGAVAGSGRILGDQLLGQFIIEL
jgi:hypothetical protein